MCACLFDRISALNATRLLSMAPHLGLVGVIVRVWFGERQGLKRRRMTVLHSDSLSLLTCRVKWVYQPLPSYATCCWVNTKLRPCVFTDAYFSVVSPAGITSCKIKQTVLSLCIPLHTVVDISEAILLNLFSFWNDYHSDCRKEEKKKPLTNHFNGNTCTLLH